jgi:prefoldin subunit 5
MAVSVEALQNHIEFQHAQIEALQAEVARLQNLVNQAKEILHPLFMEVKAEEIVKPTLENLGFSFENGV